MMPANPNMIIWYIKKTTHGQLINDNYQPKTKLLHDTVEIPMLSLLFQHIDIKRKIHTCRQWMSMVPHVSLDLSWRKLCMRTCKNAGRKCFLVEKRNWTKNEKKDLPPILIQRKTKSSCKKPRLGFHKAIKVTDPSLSDKTKSYWDQVNG